MEGNVPEVSTFDARKQFSTLVNRVAFGKERIALTRRGRVVAGVVSVHDLARLVKQDAPPRPVIRSPNDLAAALRRELGLDDPLW
jgi:prevent-host-death family protein